MGKGLFRSCWFAYARLQLLEGDFQCPRCGVEPSTVIWDGVTLAFHRRQLLPTIRPPTAISDSSQVRSTKYILGQHAVQSPILRKLLRTLLKQDPKKPSDPIAENPELVTDAFIQLSGIHEDLGKLFKEHVRSSPHTDGSPIPLPIRNFFIQACFYLSKLSTSVLS